MTYVQTEESKERNEREHTRQQLAEFLWRREGGHCVSYLVSTLAQNADDARGNKDLAHLCEQAFQLAAPVPDYEEAATDAGWSYNAGDEHWYKGRSTPYNNAENLCDVEHIDPYDREVYEHWIVSNWLADKLTAKGEKCAKDFAGLTVWARTTTGQSIACDGVMQEIACNLWPTAEDRKRILT